MSLDSEKLKSFFVSDLFSALILGHPFSLFQAKHQALITLFKTHHPTLLIWDPSTALKLKRFLRTKRERSMYPKVKVRVQDDVHVSDDQKRKYLLSLKDLESLFHEASYSPAREHCVFPSSLARIPDSYAANPSMPSISMSKEEEIKGKQVDENDKLNIRASVVPRPRAVLSSPDNDEVIGEKNKKKEEKPSVLKNHNAVQSRHWQCKSPGRADSENPANARKSKGAAIAKKSSSVSTVSSQPRNVRTQKPKSVQFLGL